MHLAGGELQEYLRLDAGKLDQLQEYLRLDAGKLEVSCRNT